MSDKNNGLIVVLQEDYTEEELKNLIIAIKQLRGVWAVETHKAEVGDMIAQARVDIEWKNKLLDLVRPKE
jgi:hypothetical protein